MDDILLYRDNDELHEEHLRKELEILKKNKLYAKFSKYNFWMVQVLFVDHIISKDVIVGDPSNLVAVMD